MTCVRPAVILLNVTHTPICCPVASGGTFFHSFHHRLKSLWLHSRAWSPQNLICSASPFSVLLSHPLSLSLSLSLSDQRPSLATAARPRHYLADLLHTSPGMAHQHRGITRKPRAPAGAAVWGAVAAMAAPGIGSGSTSSRRPSGWRRGLAGRHLRGPSSGAASPDVAAADDDGGGAASARRSLVRAPGRTAPVSTLLLHDAKHFVCSSPPLAHLSSNFPQFDLAPILGFVLGLVVVPSFWLRIKQ